MCVNTQTLAQMTRNTQQFFRLASQTCEENKSARTRNHRSHNIFFILTVQYSGRDEEVNE